MLDWHHQDRLGHGKERIRSLCGATTMHVLISCRLTLTIFSILSISFQGYQFWTKADKMGSFVIEKVRAGDYNLYAWVPRIIGDFKSDVNITITPGMDPASLNPAPSVLVNYLRNEIVSLISIIC